MGKTIVVVIVDTLRFDAVSTPDICRQVTPTIDALKNEGSFARIVANASNTQFVMPTLLTGTYPLDHGGYNTGCKSRPGGFVTALRNAGFSTKLFSTCVLYNRDLDFDRDFTTAMVPVNTRRSLTQDIEYNILPVLKKWHDGSLSDDAVVEFLSSDYRSVLENLIRVCDQQERIPREHPELAKRNLELGKRCRRELALLEEDPFLVAAKMLTTPEAFYWRVLGDRKAGIGLLGLRLVNRLWQSVAPKFTPKRFPHGLIDGYDVLTDELEPELRRTFDQDTTQDRLILLHLMDVHTPRLLANQYRRCPEVVARREQATREITRFDGYDVPEYLGALTCIDGILGRLVAALKSKGLWDETAFFVTADHGTTMKPIDGIGPKDLPNRFEPQDLTVPIVAAGGLAPTLSGPSELFDSRDLGATVMRAAGLPVAGNVPGVSIQPGHGRDGVVSENGGRGNLDLETDDLNFSVTGKGAQILVRLSGDQLTVVNRWEHSDTVAESNEALLDILFRERGALIEKRGAARP